MKTPKTVFAFDFDGTLASSFSLEDESMALACQRNGRPDVTEEVIHQHYGPTESGIIRSLVGEERFPQAWETFLSAYREGSKSLRPFEGIEALLHRLHDQPKTVVVLLTGRSEESLKISLADLGLEAYFDRLYWGSETGTNKSENFLAMCKGLGIAKDDALYIGDTLEDIEMMNAIHADLFSAGYSHNPSYQKKLEEKNPGRVAHTVSELSSLIDSVLRH